MEVVGDEEQPSKLNRKVRLSISFDGNLFNVLLVAFSKYRVPLNGRIETEGAKSSGGNTNQDTEKDARVGVYVKSGCRERPATIENGQVNKGTKDSNA